MPVIAIPIEELNRHLGRSLSADEMEAYLDQIGCDLDGFTKLRRYRCRPSGVLLELNPHEELPSRCPETQIEGKPEELWTFLGEVDVVKMDLLPVRPDIFDAGGLSRAIKGLLKEEIGLPRYPLAPAKIALHIDPSVAAVRPHIHCAVIRGIQLDEVGLRTLMKLQENLHWALARDRKLASIGVYDLKTLQGAIHYKAVARDSLRFIPLQSLDGKPLTPDEILTSHPKGIAYAHLLQGHEMIPLLIDDAGQVLSMPPIINSHETRVTTETTDVFLDVTGIVDRAVSKCLHTILTSLLELCPDARAEAVEVHLPAQDGKAAQRIQQPSMEIERFSLHISRANQRIGIQASRDEAVTLLRQMRHDVEIDAQDPDLLHLSVAPYRNDIMHEVDLIEDLAIAYGYQHIQPVLVPNMTVARERPERILANRVRALMTGSGYFEVMSLLLSNPQEQYELLNTQDPHEAVLLANPASVEQSLMRTRIMPQLLRLFALNRGQGLPQRLFEVDDVVIMEANASHPQECLHLAAGILDTQVGFAQIKSLAQSVSYELGMPLTYEPIHHPAFLEGRVAQMRYQGQPVGLLGEIHPAILEKLRLLQPLAVLEFSLQPLLPQDDLYHL